MKDYRYEVTLQLDTDEDLHVAEVASLVQNELDPTFGDVPLISVKRLS